MNYIYILLISFIISILSVPFYTRMAVRLGIIDIPDERKHHVSQVPLLGGLGIITAVAVCCLIFAKYNHKLLYYFISNAIIVATGVYDDRKGMSPYTKLFLEFLAATSAIFLMKIKFEFGNLDLQWINVDVVMVLFTYFWIILVTNAVNLIDGVDGLASGISFMAYASLLFAAGHGYVLNTIICLAMLGGILGFLRYNMPKASVFMGDTGSLFLGYNIALVSLTSFGKTSTLLSVLLPSLFVSIPIFDTFSAFILRVLRKQNPLKADRQHLHYRLLDLNLTSSQTLIVFYAMSILLSCIAIVFFRQDVLLGMLFTLLTLYLFIVAINQLNRPKFREMISKFTSPQHDSELTSFKLYIGLTLQKVLIGIIILALLSYQLYFYSWDIFGDYTYILYGALIFIALFYKRTSGNAVMFRCFLLYWLTFSAAYICVYVAPDTVYYFAGFAVIMLLAANVTPLYIYRIFSPLDLLNFFMVIVSGIYIYADMAGWVQTTALSLMYYLPLKILIINIHEKKYGMLLR